MNQGSLATLLSKVSRCMRGLQCHKTEHRREKLWVLLYCQHLCSQQMYAVAASLDA